jgi:hypothetical protein
MSNDTIILEPSCKDTNQCPSDYPFLISEDKTVQENCFDGRRAYYPHKKICSKTNPSDIIAPGDVQSLTNLCIDNEDTNKENCDRLFKQYPNATASYCGAEKKLNTERCKKYYNDSNEMGKNGLQHIYQDKCCGGSLDSYVCKTGINDYTDPNNLSCINKLKKQCSLHNSSSSCKDYCNKYDTLLECQANPNYTGDGTGDETNNKKKLYLGIGIFFFIVIILFCFSTSSALFTFFYLKN